MRRGGETRPALWKKLVERDDDWIRWKIASRSLPCIHIFSVMRILVACERKERNFWGIVTRYSEERNCANDNEKERIDLRKERSTTLTVAGENLNSRENVETVFLFFFSDPTSF